MREAFAPGIIALLPPDGSARQVADGLTFPNGMCVSPDNQTLIVAEPFAGVLAHSGLLPMCLVAHLPSFALARCEEKAASNQSQTHPGSLAPGQHLRVPGSSAYAHP